jgi:hypothetical protein
MELTEKHRCPNCSGQTYWTEENGIARKRIGEAVFHEVHKPYKVNGKHYGYYIECHNNDSEEVERIFIGY